MKLLRIHERHGLEEYSQTLALQEQLLNEKIAEANQPDSLVLVEHQPVYTLGRGASFTRPQLPPASEVPCHEISRGGQVTFHGPGQLVVYPIFDLTQHGKDVHVFLRNLERAILQVLQRFGLSGYMREGLTGVWLDDVQGQPKKIASIGIGVRRWTSYHGLALNVHPDLEYFRAISPCGQDGQVMTSIDEELCARGLESPKMDEVKRTLVAAFLEIFGHSLEVQDSLLRLGRPKWLKVRAGGSPEFQETVNIVRDLKLVTVCEEACCPNMGECWSHRTATFMVMGELCTRRCSFCSVKDGALENLNPLDPMEPLRVGKAVHELGLKHVVITSVNRDDLPDMGARHFDVTVRAIKHQNPDCAVELLIPDMRGQRNLLAMILESGMVTVLNHNVETVPRLYRTVRPGAKFQRSLDVLRWARELWPKLKTKSGLMVGLGEQSDEVLAVMDALRESDVQILTIGQYLQPTKKQLPVQRFVSPEEFAFYQEEGMKRGFAFVESGPLVRSSYHAWRHVAAPGEQAISAEREVSFLSA